MERIGGRRKTKKRLRLPTAAFLIVGCEASLSAAVRRPRSNPLVLHGIIMLGRVVKRDVQAETIRSKAAHRGEDRVACCDHVAFRTCKADLCGNHIRLRIEYIERGALTHVSLLNNAAERKLRC